VSSSPFVENEAIREICFPKVSLEKKNDQPGSPISGKAGEECRLT
jgi:hypothetical protein